MRLHTLYLLFIFIITSAWAANPPTLIKGSVYAANADGDIIYMFETDRNSKLLFTGDEIYVKELVEFKTMRDKCELQLFLSNKANIFVHKKGWFTIENFEHFIDRDEKGNPIGGGDILNMYVRGKVDFKLDTLSEGGYVSVNTGTADLEIKSKEFYVESSDYNTIVECYEGQILLTDSVTLKLTTLEAGNYAEVISSGGEKNTTIRIAPLLHSKLESRKERICNSPPVEWKFSSKLN
jgi:hypothetical protein